MRASLLRLFVPAIAVLLLPVAARSQEGDKLPLKSRYLKGDKITSDNTAKVDMEISMQIPGGEQGGMKLSMQQDHKLVYDSQILELSDDGLIQKELREITTAKSTSKQTMDFGDSDTDSEPTTETLPLEGCSFEITRGEDSATVTPKGGDAKDLPKEIVNALTIHEGVERLLPEKAVAKGDTWTVSGKKLLNWARQQVSLPGKPKIDGTIECTLKEITQTDKSRVARVTYTVDLEASFDPSEAATGEGDEDNDAPGMKMKMEFIARVKKGKGEFLFNIDEGSAVSSEARGEIEIEMTQQMGDQEITGKGKGNFESKSTWTVKERATPTK